MTAALVSIALAPPAAIATGSSPPHHSGTPSLRLVRRIALPGINGPLDRMAIDLAGHRLFVAAPRMGRVEIVDLAAGRRSGELGPVDRPGGLAYATHAKTLFVAESSGTVVLFHPGDHAPTHCVTLPGGAGIVRYDAAAERIFVGGGRGIAILDATTGDSLGTIPLASRPEDFEIEPSGPRLFVNLPSAGRIAVVDRNERAILRTWNLGGAHDNGALAFDPVGQRLWVACRVPPRLRVLAAHSGKTLATTMIGAGAADASYDAARRRAYVSGGSGVIDVVRAGPETYRRLPSVPTARGARTSLFVPEQSRLYVAVPASRTRGAEIRVYTTR